MKYDVTYSCGHIDELNLCGTTSEREKMIAYLSKYGVCPMCTKKERQKMAAKQLNEGLPDLKGTEKQITWATFLRQQFMDDCKNKNMPDEVRPIYNYIIANVTDAHEWIDNRTFLLGLFKTYKDVAL